MCREVKHRPIPGIYPRACGERRQDGIALVIVLWLTAMLAVMAITLFAEQRSEIAVTRNLIESAKTQSSLYAGVQLGIHELSGGEITASSQRITFNGTQLEITVVPESSKVDINYASESLLDSMFDAAGIKDDLARTHLVDALLDWRDSDRLRRLHGYEADDYERAGYNYRPRDGQFQSIEELALVDGINPQLFHRISDVITIYAGARSMNPEVASTLYEHLSSEGVITDGVVSKDWQAGDGVTRVKVRTGAVYTIRCTTLRKHGANKTAELTVRVLSRHNSSNFVYNQIKWRLLAPPSSS